VSEWVTKALGDVCEILDSKRRPITKKDRIPGEFPYYGATGILDFVEGYLFDEKLVLVGEDGAKWGAGENTAFRVDGKVWVNNHAHVIRPRRRILHDSWLIYYLNSIDLLPFISGLTVPKLNQAKLREIPIPLPPAAEQQRIVAILDEAFAGLEAMRANAERNVQNARELFDAYLQIELRKSSASGSERTLQEISIDFGRGKSKHRPRNDPKLYDGRYPFIQTGDVRNCDHFIIRSSQSYNEVGLAQSKLWPKGTICVTIAANIAETGILGFDACFPDSVIGIVVDQRKTSNDYVEFLLQSVKAELKAQGKGSAQDNINLATFENRRFPFPPIHEQHRIVDALNELSDAVRSLTSLYTRKFAAIAELKQSLLQKAFSGQLTSSETIAA